MSCFSLGKVTTDIEDVELSNECLTNLLDFAKNRDNPNSLWNFSMKNPIR